MSEPAHHKASPWAPLRAPLFRWLWIASIASNVGTWVHDVGASWTMTSLAPSPLLVSLVKAAEALPIFIFALPAGALADILDKRRLLIGAQFFMLVTALSLSLLTWAHLVTPLVLLLITACLASGLAFAMPAWQSILPEVVERPNLSAAIALNSMGVSISRAVGPAIGGLIVAAAGAEVAFALNAISFVGIMAVLAMWNRPIPKRKLPPENLFGAIRLGLRYARHAYDFRSVMIRAALFFTGGSAVWSLLPVVARDRLHVGPSGYGVLLSSLGLGASIAAVLLPMLRERMTPPRIVILATSVFAGAAVVLSRVQRMELVVPSLLLGGAAWLTMITCFNVSAQATLPTWVRARCLSIYLVVFFGGMAGGSTIWGSIATHHSLPIALECAAAFMMVGLLLTARLPLPTGDDVNLTPSNHWPAPNLAIEPDHDRGPVLITLRYHVLPDRVKDFTSLMSKLRPVRYQTGAIEWALYQEAESADVYIETFTVESWIEHLRQHDRVDVDTKALQDRILACLSDPKVDVRHLIAAGI